MKPLSSSSLRPAKQLAIERLFCRIQFIPGEAGEKGLGRVCSSVAAVNLKSAADAGPMEFWAKKHRLAPEELPTQSSARSFFGVSKDVEFCLAVLRHGGDL